MNWEAARLRDLVRDRGPDPTVSRVRPVEDRPAKRRRRRPRAGRNVRREQLAMFSRSDWLARADTEAWVRAEFGEAVWREIEDAMARRVS
jgi:hypothetical protein